MASGLGWAIGSSNTESKIIIALAITVRRAINAQSKGLRSPTTRAFMFGVRKQRNSGILLKLGKMRHINETFQIPPFVNEQFHDVGNVVVEFKIFEKIDEAVGLEPCDYCYYNVGGDDSCDGGLCSECLKTLDGDVALDCLGYYAKVDKNLE